MQSLTINYTFSSTKPIQVKLEGLPPGKYYRIFMGMEPFVLGNPIGQVDEDGMVTLYLFPQPSIIDLIGANVANGSASVRVAFYEDDCLFKTSINNSNTLRHASNHYVVAEGFIDTPFSAVTLSEKCLEKGLYMTGEVVRKVGDEYKCIFFIYNYSDGVVEAGDLEIIFMK